MRYKNLLLQDDIAIGKYTIIRDSIIPIPSLSKIIILKVY